MPSTCLPVTGSVHTIRVLLLVVSSTSQSSWTRLSVPSWTPNVVMAGPSGTLQAALFTE